MRGESVVATQSKFPRDSPLRSRGFGGKLEAGSIFMRDEAYRPMEAFCVCTYDLQRYIEAVVHFGTITL